MDDAQILAAVRSGDRSAAAELHARIRPQIDRAVLRLIGRGDPEHDDLVQLALIAVVTSLDRFRGDCSLDTWTARITAHTVFKAIRSRKSARKVFDRSTPREDDPPSSEDLERAALARDALRRVRSHLDALDPVKAWTVMLHDVCGHDLREISSITECSVAAAQSRLARGRRELHERLAGDPELTTLLEAMEGRS